TAQKFSHLAEFVNLRPALTDTANPNPSLTPATANIAIFKCHQPVATAQFEIKLLERHPTLQAFRCDSSVGINYKPNVWHHPMIVVEKPVQFMTITHESGVALEDCEEYWFTQESGEQGGAAAAIQLHA
ncbi:hypothetical protein BGZ98_007061, partial [Dissophora globulifera]